MDYKFFSQVRIPKAIAIDMESPSARTIIRWADRIANSAKTAGGNVEIFMPQRRGNRICVGGNDSNTFVASELIRKAVIEICNGTFDSFEMVEFVENKFDQHKREMNAKPAPLPSCRIDFKVSVENMKRKQLDSFERLSAFLEKIGVQIAAVENRPTVMELKSADAATLKIAKLTTEWAANTIQSKREITPNGLRHNFSDQSIQALGQKHGLDIARLALA